MLSNDNLSILHKDTLKILLKIGMDMLIYDAIVENTTLHDDNEMKERPDSSINERIHENTKVSITDDVKHIS